MKSLSAKIARIRPCVAMDKEMRRKSAAPFECLPALRALKIINHIRRLIRLVIRENYYCANQVTLGLICGFHAYMNPEARLLILTGGKLNFAYFTK